MNLENKKILVTGADGFIGSHLTEMLVDKSAKVTALSYYNSFNYWGWLDTVDCLNKIEVVTGDIRDANFCKRIVKDVDIVFHLAALIAIPYSYIAPDSYVDTNVKGTLNICQAGLENECERIVHTSTSEVYGTAIYVPIDEKHPLSPQSPYSATKIAADAIAESFYRSFQLPVVIARPFNTYGPRQSARAVIPTLITQLLNGSKEIKLGSLHPTRDLNYVADVCRGIISLAKNFVRKGTFVIYLSANQVFDGLVPYRLPNAQVSPITEYGRQKAKAEHLISQLDGSVAIIRFTKVLGSANPLFSKWREDLKKGKTIQPFSNMLMSPVPVSFATLVLHLVVDRRLTGILQVSGNQDISYADAAYLGAKFLGVESKLVQPVEAFQSGCYMENIPAYTTLNIDRLKSTLGIEPPDVRWTIEMAFTKVESLEDL